MSEPWEDYQRAPATADVGPWSDYARPAAVAAAPPPDMAGFGEDWQAAKAAIDKLPEAVRGKARDQYADMIVAKEREGGGALQTASDYLRRFTGSVPGIGAWAGEANAALTAATGGDYEMASAYERAKERAIKATQTPKLGTLPLIGDVTAGGLTEAAGSVIGSLEMPFARVMGGAGALPTAVNMGVTGAAYGAADGAGNADPGHTADDALKSAAISAAISAPLGAVVGRFLSPKTLNPANTPNLTTGRTLVEAADNLSMPGGVPRAVGGSEAQMRAGGMVEQMPVVGNPIITAKTGFREGIAPKAGQIADEYAPAGMRTGTGVEPEAAGIAARDAMSDWAFGSSPRSASQALNRLYEPVDTLMAATPGAKKGQAALYDLTMTKQRALSLIKRDLTSATDEYGAILSHVDEALKRPNGMEWQGIKDLRTSVISRMESRKNPPDRMEQAGLTTIKNALTDDMKIALQSSDAIRRGSRTLPPNHRNTSVLPLWEKANAHAASVAEKRGQIERIVGKEGDAGGIDILKRVLELAGSGTKADTGKLRVALAAMGPEGRSSLASAAIHRLGRNKSDEFGLAQFRAGYSALKNKDDIFGAIGGPRGNLRQKLDDLWTLTDAITKAGAVRNTSNTGGATTVGSLLLGLGAGTIGIMGALKMAVPGWVMAKFLANPVKVQNLNTGMQSLRNALTMGGTSMNEHVMRAMNGIAQLLADETQENPAEVAARMTNALKGAR